jgi:ABC-type branched-subunit amino acid transport system substrate-binding protein
MTRFLKICIGLSMVIPLGYAEAEESPAALMKAAKLLYSQQKYDSTIIVLRDYIKRHGRDMETETIVPLLMEALVRTNDREYFNKLFSIYQKKFPNSKFLPRLYYLEGVLLSGENKGAKAILSFSNCRNAGVAGALDSLSLRNAAVICDYYLGADELKRLAEGQGLNREIQEILDFYLCTSLDTAGLSAKARTSAEEFCQKYPQSRYVPRLREVLAKMPVVQTKGQIVVGVLAPISGEDADIGRQIVNSIQFAVNQFNQKSELKVKLSIADTRGNMVETAQKTREMIDNRVPVIIGPMLSKTATVTAAMLMGRDIVMVTPTATDEGIARLGSNIFQVNVTLGTLAKRIARYALENLNIKEFAIIAPTTEYGKALSGRFKEEVLRGGGTIVDEEFYDEGTHDFRVQFDSLRLHVYQHRQDANVAAGGGAPAPGNRSRKADSLYLADSTISVGGLFLPVEAEDAVMLAPQVYFHRIQTQLLGSNGWYSPTTILDGKQYVNNAIISSHFEIDPANEKWVAFNAEYKRQYGAPPDRMIAPLGYDAANIVLQAIALSGGSDPIKISQEIGRIQNYQGLSGPVTFDRGEGVNTETAILKIKDKKFVRIY